MAAVSATRENARLENKPTLRSTPGDNGGSCGNGSGSTDGGGQRGEDGDDTTYGKGGEGRGGGGERERERVRKGTRGKRETDLTDFLLSFVEEKMRNFEGGIENEEAHASKKEARTDELVLPPRGLIQQLRPVPCPGEGDSHPDDVLETVKL
jgi:hypothetical protein